MKKMILTAIFAVLLLSGCAQASGEKMTQSIQSGSLGESAGTESSASVVEQRSSSSAGESGTVSLSSSSSHVSI